jgi:hypothetical protein
VSSVVVRRAFHHVLGRRWRAGVDAHGVAHAVSAPAAVSVPAFDYVKWTLHALCDDVNAMELHRLEDRAVTCIGCVAGMALP